MSGDEGKQEDENLPPVSPETLRTITKIIKDELRSGPFPNERQIRVLARQVELVHRKPINQIEAPHIVAGQELWKIFREKAYTAQVALLSLKAIIPSSEWQKLCNRNPGLQQLSDAFDLMSDALRIAQKKEQRKRGRKMELESQFDAWSIAVLVEDMLREAGRINASMKSQNGPVNRIGAEILGYLERRDVNVDTFASRVLASLGKKSRARR